MTTSQKFLRLTIVIIPITVFCLSLFFKALSYQYIQIETPKGYELLLMGGIAILGGGMLETMIWMANPIALFAIIRFLRENRTQVKIDSVLNKPVPKLKRKSKWFSLLATAIAISFSRWNEVLAAESGSKGKILTFHTGYWLWMSSFALFTMGVIFFNFRYRETRTRMD